jgi:hypothetical protein
MTWAALSVGGSGLLERLHTVRRAVMPSAFKLTPAWFSIPGGNWMSGFSRALSDPAQLVRTSSHAAIKIDQRATASATPSYHCCLLDARGRAEEIVIIRAADAAEAERKAIAYMSGDAAYSGFELWNDGRMVMTCKPTQNRAPECSNDPVARKPRARSAARTVARQYRSGQA